MGKEMMVERKRGGAGGEKAGPISEGVSTSFGVKASFLFQKRGKQDHGAPYTKQHRRETAIFKTVWVRHGHRHGGQWLLRDGARPGEPGVHHQRGPQAAPGLRGCDWSLGGPGRAPGRGRFWGGGSHT